MKETVVEVKDVSIKFNMSSEKYDSFKEYIIKMIKQQITYHSFWALKNVSFEVKKGDTLGLIGLNGTVLFVSHSIEQVKKICNKIVWLDHGKVRMYGNTREVCEEYEKI